MRKESKDTIIKKFIILTDNREQLPFKFPNQEFCTLQAGDYSIKYENKTYENMIIVERKGSVSELFSASGKGRDRFERELTKLKKVPCRLVLCEFRYMDIVNSQPPGILPSSSVYGSICSWMVRFNIPFIFCENRQNARGYLWKLFYEYTKHQILGY